MHPWVQDDIYVMGKSVANCDSLMSYNDVLGFESEFADTHVGKDAYASFAQGQGEGALSLAPQGVRYCCLLLLRVGLLCGP